MAAQKDFDIAIIGGGITGVTLAIALLKHNVRVQVYEQGRAFSEIGAGVAFGPNAVRAMTACDPAILTAFEGVATHNQWESKSKVYFDFIDGMASSGETIFKLENPQGANSTHRADFMEAMAKLIPPEIAHFRKRLEHIEEDPKTGRLLMKFHDGTTADADAVIGCDGIKSRTRAIMLGENHPSAKPQYSHKYCYRAVIPMERAVSSIGEERAMNACMWLGDKRHVLTFPINRGKTFNLAAMVTDECEWPSDEHLTLPAHKEDALNDFSHFGSHVRTQLELINEDVDKWALFDLASNPLPTFHGGPRGRIVLLGDASHATTPHHGSGAGFGIEDSATLAALLLDARVSLPSHLPAAFAAFDAARRARDQWLVADSRYTGELYQWSAPAGDGDGGGVARGDWPGLERLLRESFGRIWDYDLDAALREAADDLGERLAAAGADKKT
ncbi:salicylate 1-monooxygenase sala [Xylariaceae sp. FL1651]|nr:salicylate 1-monooxygenase sala [Xylariaceae sp. FL1651]